MSDLITSDAPLTVDKQSVARAVTDLVIPASPDGRLPSAAGYDVVGFIAEDAPEQLASIAADLDELMARACETYERSFLELQRPEQEALVSAIREENPAFLRTLAIGTALLYYQQDQVLQGIGLEPRPPFPNGYTVKSGDLTLLDPVRARGQRYRDA